MPGIDYKALMHIEACRDRLTRQQFLTLRGQVIAGDGDGAMKGLRNIIGGYGGGMTLDRLLKRKMDDYGWDVMKMAAEVGCPWQYIYRLVNEGAWNIQQDMRSRLCRALDIAPDVLDAAIWESMKAR